MSRFEELDDKAQVSINILINTLASHRNADIDFQHWMLGRVDSVILDIDQASMRYYSASEEEINWFDEE